MGGRAGSQKTGKIITSVPGVDIVTALQILIKTNEFKDIECPKKFVFYSGVAPFRQGSGTVKLKPQVSAFANKRMKSLLHICAVSIIRCDVELEAFYERKTLVEGKPKCLLSMQSGTKLSCVFLPAYPKAGFIQRL